MPTNTSILIKNRDKTQGLYSFPAEKQLELWCDSFFDFQSLFSKWARTLEIVNCFLMTLISIIQHKPIRRDKLPGGSDRLPAYVINSSFQIDSSHCGFFFKADDELWFHPIFFVSIYVGSCRRLLLGSYAECLPSVQTPCAAPDHSRCFQGHCGLNPLF